MADLIRLWTFVRLFHVDEQHAIGTDWEDALAEAAKPALEARDDAAFAIVVKRMMAHIQPSDEVVAQVQDTAPEGAANLTPFRLVGGVAVGSCPAIADAISKGKPSGWREPAIAAAIRRSGMILDCRIFAAGPAESVKQATFDNWFDAVSSALIERPVVRGAKRTRFHDGYPADSGSAPLAYSRGLTQEQWRRLEPVRIGDVQPIKKLRIVVVLDSSHPTIWSSVSGLQAANQAWVVVQGPVADPSLFSFQTKHLSADVKTAEYIAPDGRIGFKADSCVASDDGDEALTVASALLAGRKSHPCRSRQLEPTGTSRTPEPAIDASSGGTSSPLPLGQRIVALAKLWGTIEYFFPYKELADLPWSENLEEFIPLFVTAMTRESYEDAVMRLSQRSNDSHVYVSGARDHWLSERPVPPIYVRPVEGGFAIAGFHDPKLGSQLRIGDEIIAVDGRSAKNILADLRSLIATSTEQSLRQSTAAFLTGGKADADARLTIRRGQAAPFDVTLKRTMAWYAANSRPQTDQPSFFRLADKDIGYVDLERLAPEDADRAIDQLMDTRAIIFDLRGYPQGTAWLLAPRLALDGREGAIAAQFRRPVYRGPTLPQQQWTSFSQPIPTGTKPRYRGKIIMLIDDRAISQSEHTALFFETAAKPLFIGTPTTGANGDVTNIALPGGLSVSFTGHDVRHADGRRLQRVGIQPDLVVAPTFAGLSQGRDEVLEAGIEQARRP